MEQSVLKRRQKIAYEHGTGRVFRNVGTKLPMMMEQTVFRNVSVPNRRHKIAY